MLVHGLRLTSHSLNEDVMLCYVMCRENELHKSMASLQRLTDATGSIYECLLRLQKSLADGDVQTVQVLTNEHRVRLCLSVCLSVSLCLSQFRFTYNTPQI